MLAAATLPAAIDSITVPGPLTQSPPAKILGKFSIELSGAALIVPCSTGIPSSEKGCHSISCPMAETTISQGNLKIGSGASLGLGRPDASGAPIICGLKHKAVTAPFLLV